MNKKRKPPAADPRRVPPKRKAPRWLTLLSRWESPYASAMPRASASVSKATLVRVLKAIREAGFANIRVEIDSATGKIAILAGPEAAVLSLEDDLDRELAEFEARHGAEFNHKPRVRGR